ncbi:hypothetical protein O9992_06360 [Vibrio lentus]|nr:hypothetical protein [Vibrio lentus]
MRCNTASTKPRQVVKPWNELEIQNVELDIAKNALQEAARVKSEFLANMSLSENAA